MTRYKLAAASAAAEPQALRLESVALAKEAVRTDPRARHAWSSLGNAQLWQHNAQLSQARGAAAERPAEGGGRCKW